jgi:hypothetical protein
MKSNQLKDVPINVLPRKKLLMYSKDCGCQSCITSKMQVAMNTKTAIFHILIFIRKRKINKHQNISYRTPPRELFIQSFPGPE